jgi:hypothetical protein
MGDMLSQQDCLNHTMVVAPTEFIDHIPTKNTKPGEKSPAIRCHIADFVDPHNPVVYRGVLWFGVISGALRRQVGQFLAGRMTQGQATQGNNPPWQLADVTGEQGWMDFMGNWLDNTPEGKAFQAEAEHETRVAAQNASNPAPAAPAAPTVAAPPAAPVAPSAPPAAPPVSAPPPAAPTAPSVAAAPPVAAPAASQPADIAALLAAMPEDQRAAALAVLGNQQQAAH